MPSSTPTPALLIFDLDGTLVNTGPQIARAWGRILTELGREPLPRDAVERMVGDGAAKLVERGLAATGGQPMEPSFEAIVERYAATLAAEPIDAGDLYTGVAETLRQLADAGHAMAVCTNKPAAAAETALEMTGIRHFFDPVVGGGSAPALKPDPAPVRAILDHHGREPRQAVMIGDHENDVRAAFAADVPAILVTYGYAKPAQDTFGAHAIDSFGALPGTIAAFAANA
ncbi:MAG: HAD-IA family hydrolase [Pseudomonadota bacterium]